MEIHTYYVIFVYRKISKGNALSKLKENTFRRINPFKSKTFYI